jgi:GTP cyclohydrolase IA
VIDSAIKMLLETIGEDPTREGLKKTPERFQKGMAHLLSGYQINPSTIIDSAMDYNGSELIILKDINFTSICEHHLLPFIGKMHVAYLPNEKIIGIGKITQIIEALTKRLQLQERLMEEIANTLQNSVLNPKGVIIKIEAQHLCMQISASNAAGTTFSTSFCTGEFRNTSRIKEEFLLKIK